jgi:hypothetical protein
VSLASCKLLFHCWESTDTHTTRNYVISISYWLSSKLTCKYLGAVTSSRLHFRRMLDWCESTKVYFPEQLTAIHPIKKFHLDDIHKAHNRPLSWIPNLCKLLF